jgi:hypothetical protein
MELDPARNGHTAPNVDTGQPARIKQTIQAAKLQRLTFDAALSLRAACTVDGVFNVTRENAVALAQLVRAWDTARNALRVLRGRGLPASVKSRAARSSAQPQPLEPA